MFSVIQQCIGEEGDKQGGDVKSLPILSAKESLGSVLSREVISAVRAHQFLLRPPYSRGFYADPAQPRAHLKKTGL
jgi:hypothetical protein